MVMLVVRVVGVLMFVIHCHMKMRVDMLLREVQP